MKCLKGQTTMMIRLKDEAIARVMGLPYPREEEGGNYAVVAIHDLYPLNKEQLKKVFELVDKIYNAPDEHLALAYLHKALSEEVK